MMIRSGWRYYIKTAAASTHHFSSSPVAHNGILGMRRVLGTTNASHSLVRFSSSFTRKPKDLKEHAPLTGPNTSPSPTDEEDTETSSVRSASDELDQGALAETQQLSWRERAKTFAIEYGRVGVCTHIVLSVVSFSTIYACVSAGVDVNSLMSSIGFSPNNDSSTANSAGSFIIAYTVYKVCAPIRWPLTFAVTPIVLRALRRRGYMLPPIPVSPRSSPPPSSPAP